MERNLIFRNLLFVLFLLSKFAYSDFYGFHPNSRLYLGGGYDKFSPTEAFVRCLKSDGVESVSRGKAVTSSFEITGVRSSREFHKKLGFSSFLEGSFLFTDIEASVSFDSETNFSENSVNWLVLLKADYGSFLPKNPRLSDELLKLPVFALRERCGSEFVIEEKRSIMVFALLSMKNIKESQRKSLEAKLSVLSEGFIFDASFEASYKDFMSKSRSMGEISIKLFSYGGKGLSEFKDLLDLNSFMNYKKILGTFNSYIGNMEASDAAPTLYVTTGLDNFVPGPFEKVSFQKGILVNLYYRYQALIKNLNSVSHFLENTPLDNSDYDFYSKERRKIQKILSKVEKKAESCFNKDKQELCSLVEDELDYNNQALSKKITCEKARQKALNLGKIEDDFYKISKKRGFYPIFRGDKILSWKPCQV